METLGANVYVGIMGRQNVPAKVDTGADSTSVWASDISVTEDEILRFKLFGPNSPFYNGKIIKRKDYSAVINRNAHGDEKIFYRTHLIIKINNRKIRVLATLADRRNNSFPILIGKRTINRKFIVDVSQSVIPQAAKPKMRALDKELRDNPCKFHQKYFKNKERQ